jgi:hypothetical protein
MERSTSDRSVASSNPPSPAIHAKAQLAPERPSPVAPLAQPQPEAYVSPPAKPTEAQRASIEPKAPEQKAPIAAAAKASVQPEVQRAEAVPSAALNRKGRPVTFMMGGDEDESEEEEEDEAPAPAQRRPAAAAAPAKQQPAPTAAAIPAAAAPAETDEEGWSSDTTVDSEEERRTQALARRRAEEERQASMFQKIPVRSHSAADLRHAAPAAAAETTGPSPMLDSPPPVRGLLSSLFHPEQEPHPPPGQLAGRPHASAADLRHRPASSALALSRLTQPEAAAPTRSSRRAERSSGGGSSHAPQPTRTPSAHPVGDGGLRTSKSAVALPVLNTTASRSSTSISSLAVTAMSNSGGNGATSSRARKESLPHEGGAEQSAAHDAAGTVSPDAARSVGSSAALAHLSQLASTRRSSNARSSGALASLARRAASSDAPAPTLSHGSPSDRPRGPPSPRTEVAELAEAVRAQQQVPQQQSFSSSSSSPPTPEAMAAPSVAQHRAVPTPAGPAAMALAQTPRTTRRNMLRDELSESIRQNLLWERQSRNRMLGIGNPSAARQAEASRAAQQANAAIAQHHQQQMQAQGASAAHSQRPPVREGRNQTVLGGGPLRPLTSAAPPGATRSRSDHSGLVQQEQMRQERHELERRQQQQGGSGAATNNASSSRRLSSEYGNSFHTSGW